MYKVNNRKLIWKLTIKSLKVNQTRNRVAIIAIALTTLLFSSIFSIGGTLLKSFQEESFRQSGGYDHVSIKDISEEQIEELSRDSAIVFSGKRLFLGFCEEDNFEEIQTEVSYMDKNSSKTYYSVPEHGSLPKEGTKEVAMDSKALELLGIKPELGTEIPLTITVGLEEKVTDTFTLCGWWEHDPANMASQILVPKSYCLDVFDKLSKDVSKSWTMGIMFRNSWNLDGKLNNLLNRHGYQNENPEKDHYLSTGVNWGYLSTQFGKENDIVTVVAVLLVLFVVLFSGYLIIYNIFQISVQKDIQYYGLLKTIGTTKTQIQKMIRIQAFLFSVVGIPLGLILGFLVGNALVPVILKQMNQSVMTISIHPLIFLGASLFSVLTVSLSCEKPGKIAGKVQPLEALRYVESKLKKKKSKGSDSRARILKMAFANLGRNRKKTVTVVLSLTLSAVLFYLVFAFSKGFDMDKFTEKFYTSDFMFASKNYFKYEIPVGVEEETMLDLEVLDGVTESGRIYCSTQDAWLKKEVWQISEDFYRKYENDYAEEEKPDENGLYCESIELYGMDEFPASYLEVLEGDVSKALQGKGNNIIAVVETDDFGTIQENSCPFQVGDQIKVSYYEDRMRYDKKTGEKATRDTNREDLYWEYVNRRDVDYTICAKVVLPYPMSSRFFSSMRFILGSDHYVKDTGSDFVLSYLFNGDNDQTEEIQEFLEQYTKDSAYGFESKKQYQEQFSSFRNMFLLVGGILAFIIGLIGVVNFFNSILTGIQSRKREFAMLQSVGMTGRQLRKMLIYEGIFYTLSSVLLATVLTVLLQVFVMKALTKVLWFFTLKVTLLPLFIILPIYLLLGILIPVVCYGNLKKSSIVERLRDSF